VGSPTFASDEGILIMGHSKQRRSIFVAYPYRLFPKEDYRRVFRNLENKHDVSFVFADAKITDDHIFEKIARQIRDAIFGLYDISGWNANVTLELGYALGTGKHAFILMDPSKTPSEDSPSDLRGRDRINFKSYSELEDGISVLLFQELKPVTYGSTVRLQHISTGEFLHSTTKRYTHEGSSKQLDVVGVKSPDYHSNWIVRSGSGAPEDHQFGTLVSHGETIRLAHVATGGYLHSHAHVSSPVTNQQEVTVFDPGRTDANDDWRLELATPGAWTKWDRIRLIHTATNHTLHSHPNALSSGEQEVTCFDGRDDNDYWKIQDN
jgi:hypothetical protein